MAQIFHPSFNTISKASIFGAVFIVAGGLWTTAEIQRSSYVTDVQVIRPQPVPFSHEHHVSGLGIDCRYCHSSVMDSSYAGIPPTKTCMTCHSQIWSESAMLEPVRSSWYERRPLEWTRVNDVADFVYFDHSIHVRKGVGCSTCHGRVDLMPMTYKAESLHMEWCLRCHREPERYLRARHEIFDMSWKPGEDQLERGRELLEEYRIRTNQLTDCSICHR